MVNSAKEYKPFYVIHVRVAANNDLVSEIFIATYK